MRPSSPIVHSSNPLIRTRCPLPPAPVLVPTSVQWYCGARAIETNVAHEDSHVGKGVHEGAGGLGNRLSADGRSAVVDRERAARRVLGSGLRRILATPGFRV